MFNLKTAAILLSLAPVVFCSGNSPELTYTTCQQSGSSPTRVVPGNCLSANGVSTKYSCQGNNQAAVTSYSDGQCSTVKTYYSGKFNSCLGTVNVTSCSGGPTTTGPSGSYYKREIFASSSCSGSPESLSYEYVNSSCSGSGKYFCSGSNRVYIGYERADCSGKMGAYEVIKANICSKSLTGYEKSVSCGGTAAPAKSLDGKVFIQKRYSGTTCQGQEIVTIEDAIGLCRTVTATLSTKMTCNATHATRSVYSTQDCTGATSSTEYFGLTKCRQASAAASISYECGSPLQTGGTTRAKVLEMLGVVAVVAFLASV